MEIKFNHLALLVTDLEKARQFYGNILGLKEIERPEFFIKGIWYTLGSCQLHLMLHEKAYPPQVHPLCETIQPHFALSMDHNKMLTVLKNLQNAGITLIQELNKTPEGTLQAFFCDDDKNMIEINNQLAQ